MPTRRADLAKLRLTQAEVQNGEEEVAVASATGPAGSTSTRSVRLRPVVGADRADRPGRTQARRPRPLMQAAIQVRRPEMGAGNAAVQPRPSDPVPSRRSRDPSCQPSGWGSAEVRWGAAVTSYPLARQLLGGRTDFDVRAVLDRCRTSAWATSRPEAAAGAGRPGRRRAALTINTIRREVTAARQALS